MSAVLAVFGGNFEAAAKREGQVINAWLKGAADRHAIVAVETLLARVHAEAVRRGIAEAVIDLRQLDQMSSSCFRNFLGWLADVLELSEDRRYKVRFLFNPALPWQIRTLRALRSFAAGFVTMAEQR